MLRSFVRQDTLRRLPFGIADVAVIAGALGAIILIAKVGAGAFVPFNEKVVPHVELNPRNLPYYAMRSTLRMFVALAWSFAFTFVYGYVAARSRRAERVLIPLLDILQSVPVLGFLSVIITGFIALFPGSLLGLEFAAIFAIFTSQAWNMTFSFYQSLRTIPNEMIEASRLYRLSGWQRFVDVEVPASMIPLLWNAMMSFGGGWFFLAASESISVLNHNYTLPGVGSYVATAVQARDMPALGWAVLTIAVVIVTIDQLFWRPLLAWSDKFRIEQSASAASPQSWVYDIVRAAHIPAAIGRAWDPVASFFSSLFSRFSRQRARHVIEPSYSSGVWFNALLAIVIAGVVIFLTHFVLTTVGIGEVAKAFALGAATMCRVFVLLIFASLVWTPIGVAIGFNPRLAQFAQPVVQFLASFPANFVFPFATLAFIRFHIPIDFGSILLMALGSQWYILFNAIAGAQSIPNELREMGNDYDVTGWLRWRRIVIPGIFSSWVTGAITASGGAWNASIVSEIVSWGNTTLTAFGLGTYITHATNTGDWPRIALGVCVMSLFVVTINRVVWRNLYHYAERRFAS